MPLRRVLTGVWRWAATRGVARRGSSRATCLRIAVRRCGMRGRSTMSRRSISGAVVRLRRNSMERLRVCACCGPRGRRSLQSIPVFAIRARGIPELVLRGRRRIVPATSCRKLCSGWPSRRTATAAVEADAIHATSAGYSAAVHVVNNRAIDVRDGAVVVKRSVIPIPAVVAETRITEPVVDSSIESNGKAPISFVPSIHAIAPAPIPWRPERASEGRKHPRAGHPIIAGGAISPVTWRPDVSFTWTNRLRVNRQERRSDGDGYEDRAKGYNRDRQQNYCNQHQPNSSCHFAHPTL
jgi:hypothetical protein